MKKLLHRQLYWGGSFLMEQYAVKPPGQDF